MVSFADPKNLATYCVRLHGAEDARMVGDRFRIAIHATHRAGYDCTVLRYCRPTYDDVRRELGY